MPEAKILSKAKIIVYKSGSLGLLKKVDKRIEENEPKALYVEDYEPDSLRVIFFLFSFFHVCY